MRAAHKKSSQTSSWTKIIAHDTETYERRTKSVSSVPAFTSKGLQHSAVRKDRTSALTNKSNVFQKPDPKSTEMPIKTPCKTPINEVESKDQIFKVPIPPYKENMFICPEPEDDFIDLVPKQYRLNDSDIEHLKYRSGFFINSDLFSDEDDDNDLKFESNFKEALEIPFQITMPKISEELEYFDVVSSVPPIEYSSEDDYV